MIAVGDPRQYQPVGAGGLWDHIEQPTRTAGAHVELTRNQRARDPADRRDQALLSRRPRRARDPRATPPATASTSTRPPPRRGRGPRRRPRRPPEGKPTTVIAQTSNDHLDELNARAQAIRHQAGELGKTASRSPAGPTTCTPRRPRTAPPHHRAPRPRTAAQRHHRPNHRRRRRTPGHSPSASPTAALTLTAQQADGDLRLPYVQHPFPAQGQTTDTAHLIIAEHATREGSYVGLTRARAQTHIYAPDPTTARQPASSPPSATCLQALAEHMSRTEPEMPSIRTPLAHEQHTTHQHTHEQRQPPQPQREPERHHRELDPAPPRPHPNEGRELAQQLERARAELNQAQQVLDSYPATHASQREAALRDAEHAAHSHANHLQVLDRLQRQRDTLGLFARHSHRAHDLNEQIAR